MSPTFLNVFLSSLSSPSTALDLQWKTIYRRSRHLKLNKVSYHTILLVSPPSDVHDKPSVFAILNTLTSPLPVSLPKRVQKRMSVIESSSREQCNRNFLAKFVKKKAKNVRFCKLRVKTGGNGTKSKKTCECVSNVQCVVVSKGRRSFKIHRGPVRRYLRQGTLSIIDLRL